MTQITGHIPPSRRPGELGVHSINGFTVSVPDLTEASKFYSTFGLEVRDETNGFGLYTEGNAHRWGGLSAGSRKKLAHISFGAFEDDFERLRARLQKEGVKQLDAPAGFESNGIWFRDPDGTLMEICVAAKTSPNEKTKFSAPSAPSGVHAAPSRSQAPIVRPRRFAHLALFSTDVIRSIEFYRRVLGLALSDRSSDLLAFMHGIHGSDHHIIALAKSNGPGLHHMSWDIGSINEIGLGAAQMADKGFVAGWGLGRHVLGSNYFHYVRDPWGSYCEYSADMDYIPANHDWDSGDRPAEDAFYLWGPTPPPDFGTNYESAN